MVWLENSIALRMGLLSQEITDENFESIEDQIIAYVASTEQNSNVYGSLCGVSTCHECPNCIDHDSDELTAVNENELKEVRQRKTSDSSLPDTDSAVESIFSSEFERLNRKCGKPEVQPESCAKQELMKTGIAPIDSTEKFMRETLV